jgi:PAS domain S-box-containing protein
MNWSIERKLPLFVTVLLLAVVLALLIIGYGEVRRASRQLANARLQRASQQLAESFQRSLAQYRTQTLAVARDPGVVAFLISRGQHAEAQARAALAHIALDTVSNIAAELWTTDEQLLLRSGRLRSTAAVFPATDSAAVSPLMQFDTILHYQVTATVRDGAQVLGTARHVRRINLNAQARAMLTGLAGGDALLLLGNAAGAPWTDFASVVSAPPATVLQSATPARYERGETKLASAAAVPGSPWMVVVEVPSRLVLAPARAYLRRMMPIAALVVLLGALGGWVGSRRVTAPLREITTAAEAIAAGELDRRVQVTSEDELGRLGRSFNTMAAQVTRALQTTEMRLRSVSETAHDAIIAADADGIIQFWNPGAARMFGYSADEILGQPLTVLMPARFHDAHRTGIRRYVATREAHVVGKTVELAGRRKDGSEFPIELSLGAAPVNGVLSFTGVIRDITERIRSAAALEATNAELESFSYSVSHDLRAPLRAIHGFSRILLEDHNAKLDAEAQRLLGVIDQNTRRMGQLIDDLLAFSRLGRQEITAGRVDMKELTTVVADDIKRAEGERNGKLEIRIGALPPARGDRALLRQVVSNLLQNAVKFTRGRDNARIEVGSRLEGKQTVYYVKDNGAGFDLRYADKLFGVFQRLHRAEDFEGTGVGLAIVKRIVQRHGGRVWAEGKVDEGATFYFTLPFEES